MRRRRRPSLHRGGPDSGAHPRWVRCHAPSGQPAEQRRSRLGPDHQFRGVRPADHRVRGRDMAGAASRQGRDVGTTAGRCLRSRPDHRRRLRRRPGRQFPTGNSPRSVRPGELARRRALRRRRDRVPRTDRRLLRVRASLRRPRTARLGGVLRGHRPGLPGSLRRNRFRIARRRSPWRSRSPLCSAGRGCR